MKKALILVFSLFILFSFNCATTQQDVSKTEETTQEAEKAEQSAVGDIDLTGTWILTYDTLPDPHCGSRGTETYTVEFIQKGDTVTWVDKESGETGIDKIYGYTMLVPAIVRTSKSVSGGKTSFPDRKYEISKDGNTFTGKYRWTWHGSTGSCGGVTKVSGKRK